MSAASIYLLPTVTPEHNLASTLRASRTGADLTLVPTSLRKPDLTPREVEVLLAWFACDSKTDVARRLFVSLGTVNTHLSRIRSKYSNVNRPAPSKASLVARALQDGLVAITDL
jgi:DNA-binding NarL/FixJ family response regulator